MQYQGSQKSLNDNPLKGGPFKGSIILCADNDDHKPNSQTYKTIESTKSHFESQGKSVVIIKPNEPGDGFNEVLKKQGVAGIQEYVKPYLDPERQHIQSLHSSNEHDSGQSTILESKGLDPKVLEAPLSLKEDSLHREFSSVTTPAPLSSPSNKPEPKPIEIAADYIESLLRKTKAFEGYSLGDEAKQELKTYLQLLQRNEITLPALMEHNPYLAQDAHEFMERQTRHKSKGRER